MKQRNSILKTFWGFAILASFFLLFSCGDSVEIPESVKAFEEKIPENIDYNLHIKPILSDRCFICHGPDKSKIEAGLQLATFEGATKKLDGGTQAIVAGNISRSELVKRILSQDPELMMPVPSSNLTLTDEEKAILIKWINQGAKYKEHWSLSPIEPQKVPDVGTNFLARWGWKEDDETRWVKNEIDHFALRKWKELKLKPSPEADKNTLLRRVSMDLIGLPPSPQEVMAFQKDDSENAYEKAVDRLLASPHFGEQQAVSWLDLARYADSHGYQDDGLRNASPYRDWVIHSFNKNLSLDKFVMYQLAGDLMPKPTTDMMIATSFNRQHPQSQEGGIVLEEYRTEYVADRTNTFGTALLGLTMECCRCHDHKYDPILAKDYYSLSAFFNQNNESGEVPYNGEAPPTVMLMDAAQTRSLARISKKIKIHNAKMEVGFFENEYHKWLKNNDMNTVSKSIELDRLVHFSFEKNTDEKGFSNSLSGSFYTEFAGDLDRSPQQVGGKVGKGLLFKGDCGLAVFDPGIDKVKLTSKEIKEWKPKPPKGNMKLAPLENRIYKGLNFEQSQDFAISIWVKPVEDSISGIIFHRSNNEFEGFRGYSLYLNSDKTLTAMLSYVWPGNCIEFRTKEKLTLNQWQHLVFNYDGSGKASGLKLYINGKEPKGQLIADNLKKSILVGENRSSWNGVKLFSVGFDERRKTISGIGMDELSIYKRQLSRLEIQSMAKGKDIVNEVFTIKNRNAQQEALLLEHHLLTSNQTFRNLKLEKNNLRLEEVQLTTDIPEVMTMQDLPKNQQRKTFILNRGAYDAFGEEVMAETPEVLGKLPPDYPRNRFGLAKWLLNEKNPLFARVMANRIWLQFFGNGLVKTQEDFGNQGNLPSHPGLLDWLAFQYRKDAWNNKKFIKRIVMSATYRQSSKADKNDIEKDPDNKWLTRGPSYRFSAEQVRDNALVASGLLVRKIGGKSVYPYQPEGIWEALATRNAINYKQDHSDSLYRRSIYTIWKRSAPPPMMLNFDAPDRSLCAVRRQKTATPLQALVTLNDPQFVEAARVLAERTVKAKSSLDEQIRWIFLSAISRSPRPKELALMKELYQLEKAGFDKDKTRAKALLKTGEFPVDSTLNSSVVAGLTVVSNTVLNYDEALIKR